MLLRRLILLLVICTAVNAALAQKNQSQGQPSGASGLTGETHNLNDWPSALPPDIRDFRVVAYKVTPTNSPSQPLILERDCAGDPTRCLPTRRNPLRDSQTLVIEIVDSNGLLSGYPVKLLNLNIVFQAASSITPDQVRPSLSTSGGGGSGGANVAAGLPAPGTGPARNYYLVWPTPLNGDTVPTVTIAAVMNVTARVRTITTPPTNATAGSSTQSVDTTSEQIVNLLNVQYPQVHSLYSFNVSTGVIYSTLRNPSWTRVESAAAVTCPPNSTTCTPSPEMYQTVFNQGSRQIDPALFFTAYVFGKFDAEMKEHWSDLKPEPSVGLSLSSPSTDFFFGASSEVWRSVQIVQGVHYGKINYLVPPLINDPTSSTAPTTTQKFHYGYFVGVTFNINFIQGLFGGGKGGGG